MTEEIGPKKQELFEDKTLVVPAERIIQEGFMPSEEDGGFREFKNFADFIRLFRVAKEGAIEARTTDAENNPDFQQIILSGVLVNPETNKFLIFRKNNVGEPEEESRLTGKDHLFLGGHMDVSDGSLIEGFYRELGEELEIKKDGKDLSWQSHIGEEPRIDRNNLNDLKKDFKIKPKGIIKNVDDEVGQMHLGIFSVIEVSDKLDISLKDEENERGEWVSVEEYKQKVQNGQLNPARWTQIAVSRVLENYFNNENP